MKSTLNYLSFLALLIAAAVLPARAQDQPPPQVTIQFTIFSLVNLPITDLVYGDQHIPFTVQGFSRSSAYQYTGSTTMKFYRMQDKNGTKVPMDAGSVELPPKAKKVLLVFAGGPPDYSIGALDDSGVGFGLGTARLCNATVFKLQLRVNDKTVIELGPGESKVMPAPDGIGVEVAYFKENKWVAATSNTYDVPKTARMNLFLLTTDNSARFNFPRAVQIYTNLEKPTTPGAPATNAAPRANTPPQPNSVGRQQ